MATKPLPFTLTHESITVVYEGKPHVVQKGSPQFNALRKAILAEDWKAVPKNLTVAKSIKDWAKGKFTMKDDHFYFEGNEIPSNINTRIVKMATSGEDPTPLFKFWERLQKNPSMRSVEQLWPFLEHKGIPLTKEGCFLAYKGVRNDFLDAHSGTISNKPGTVHEMPRNQISDDPNHACHEGFHVGALAYAGSFSQRVVICEVDPEHVVCVPYDASQHKMRVCKYKVIGQHNGSHMSSTTHEEDAPRGDASYEHSHDVPKKDSTQFDPNDETDANYDPENDFLAEPCDECGNKIPPDHTAEDNKYHMESCSLYDPTFPEEEKKAKAPAKKKKGSEKKKEHKAKKKAGKQLVQTFDKLKKMGMPDLMKESIDTLRAYAGKGLKIVGASKVPGGKTALVSVILKARE
jgi:hypothetical protein